MNNFFQSVRRGAANVADAARGGGGGSSNNRRSRHNDNNNNNNGRSSGPPGGRASTTTASSSASRTTGRTTASRTGRTGGSTTAAAASGRPGDNISRSGDSNNISENTFEGLQNMLSPELFAQASQQFEQFQEQMFASGATFGGGSVGTGGGGASGSTGSPIDFMQAMAQAAAQAQGEEPRRGAPPASKRAIRQLPTIMVKPEDLVDETNRECCICLEDNHIKDRVIRLPCAHIFHPKCIHDWLSKRNSCPVCRYELPTDDDTYEQTRLEHMKHRKPRYAKYELERMEPIELRNLCNRLSIKYPNSLTHKGELIMLILNSNKVDIIASPEPVEYPLSKLKGMRIKELKTCMEDAGVFFDPIDVIEKSDMIRIFINSGRLVLAQEEDSKLKAGDDNEEEEEFDINGGGEYGDYEGGVKRKASKSPLRSNSSNNSSNGIQVETVDTNSSTNSNGIRVETVETPDSKPAAAARTQQSNMSMSDSSSNPNASNHTSWMEPITDNDDDDNDGGGGGGDNVEEVDNNNDSTNRNGDNGDDEEEENDDYDGSDIGNNGNGDNGITRDDDNTPDVTAEEEPDVIPMEDCEVLGDDHHQSDHQQTDIDESNRNNTEEATATTRTSPEEHQFRIHCQEISISELRVVARDINIDLSDCIERGEMIDRLANACYHNNHEQQRPPIMITMNDFTTWSISDLQAIRKEIGPTFLIDLSSSSSNDRNGIIEELILSATTYPHVAIHLEQLISLSSKSVSELRTIARQWNNININGCLEKSEMIHKLILAGGPHHR